MSVCFKVKKSIPYMRFEPVPYGYQLFQNSPPLYQLSYRGSTTDGSVFIILKLCEL